MGACGRWRAAGSLGWSRWALNPLYPPCWLPSVGAVQHLLQHRTPQFWAWHRRRQVRVLWCREVKLWYYKHIKYYV
ncbi:hypothetical protein B484DRAFT_459007 [Ochromonadaceae sp. CCMP2298]|nr:hypothetical protein B484DRAFT_459007 [Ochromonadaceae sp. CCMP2298]